MHIDIMGNKMKNLVIVGAGGFGREVLEIVNEINNEEPTWNVLGFIDNNRHALDNYDLEVGVLATEAEWQIRGEEKYVIAIASPTRRKEVATRLKAKGASFATIIAPSVNIGKRTHIGEGVVIFGKTEISIDCKIGDFVFLNALDGIGHDCIIGNYCTFGPKVCISGATKMGECVNVGALASTYPGVIVEDYATIGMNSCAIKRVKKGTTVVGVPAKKI